MPKQITIAGVQIAALKTQQLRVDMKDRVDVTLTTLTQSEVGVLSVMPDCEGECYMIKGADNVRRFMSGIATGYTEFACEIL